MDWVELEGRDTKELMALVRFWDVDLGALALYLHLYYIYLGMLERFVLNSFGEKEQ